MDINALQQRLREFAAERDWEKFHSPKNLAMALAGEAGELLEVFQWLSEAESAALGAGDKGWHLARDELADLQIYLLRLADRLGVDLEQAVAEKIRRNAERYPVNEVRGDATKYSHRGRVAAPEPGRTDGAADKN
jgi:NTP pyrophosphatase (non-canonical NTP hydrolase)